MFFSQFQLYYLSYKWHVQEMTNADGDKFICCTGLDEDGKVIIVDYHSCCDLTDGSNVSCWMPRDMYLASCGFNIY